MNAKTTVSSKGQIVIPKYIRELLGLHYGSELMLNLRKDNVLEIYPKVRNIEDFFGRGRQINKQNTMTIQDIDDTIAEAASSVE